MTGESNIQPIQSDFEQIRKTAESGQGYWSARELASALGYSTWQKFNRVLNKSLQVAQNRGMEMGEHFNQVVEMVKLGSGSFREVENWHLSRLACLYTVDVSTINYHLGQIFATGVLKEEAVIRKFPITAADGKDYDTLIYNLDAIIAVGYRVNSYQATQFRIWATGVNTTSSV